jgi:hypothetical protein
LPAGAPARERGFVSFLDPYSGNRKVPLVWIGRVVLLVLLVLLFLLGRWIWGLVTG